MHPTVVYVYKRQTHCIFFRISLSYSFFFFFSFVSHWLLQHARSHISTNEPNTHKHTHERGKNGNFYNCTKPKKKKKSKIIHVHDSSFFFFEVDRKWRYKGRNEQKQEEEKIDEIKQESGKIIPHSRFVVVVYSYVHVMLPGNVFGA